MRIKTLFFAIYRDLAGADELDLEVPSGSSIADLVCILRERGGSWSALPPNPAVALNLSYSHLGASLSEGDEVAFIPPVGGG